MRGLSASTSSLKRAYSRFWPLLGNQKAPLAGSLAALVFSIILRILEPWPLKFVIDEVIGRGDSSLLLFCAVAVVAISFSRAIAEYLNKVTLAVVGNTVLAKVRNQLYRHVQGLSLRFHSEARGGDLVVRVISDVNMLRDALVTAILPLIGSVLVVVGMLIFMLFMDWRLALLSLAALPVFWLASTRIGRKIQEVALFQRKREGAMAATASESITAIKTVQALALEEAFAGVFVGKNDEASKADAKGARLSAGLERATDIVIAIATALVLYFGAKMAVSGSITAGELIVFLTYLRRLFNPLQDFAKYTARVAKASAAADRVLEILDSTSEISDMPDAIPAAEIAGNVSFENVTFAYGTDGPVLQNITFFVPQGGSLALVGESGVGKSTLAALLMRLIDPNVGSVTIDGIDIRRFTVQSLRKQVSVVLQESLLFSGTIRENIAYGTNEQFQEVLRAAKLANAHSFIEKMPQGYETHVGERGQTLSAGQRQRIAIARAAIRKTPILILDEPTIGLDEEGERLVQDALYELSKGKTTILITHDLVHASKADRIALLSNARIVEVGGHEELMSIGGRYATLYRLQNPDIGRHNAPSA
ncbi:MAG: ABC transporter ATP-binding protein/permease [Armatimonadota bacterium]|nr:ABC transporter ATP-binding protein/permease [Armatimonadota bacterium]